MPCPIVTSIPPVFSRQDAEGREIGDAYLARCIMSWRECGFDPVTVHSEREALHPLVAALEVRVVRVARDASALTGRPHVFLGDLVATALELGGARAFIINADVELEMSDPAQARLHTLGPDAALAIRRRDHDGDKERAAAPYSGGIDMIGGGVDVLGRINFGALVFGMPWWDHYLPIMLMRHNARFDTGADIHLWHLLHGGRWNKAHHILFGKEFLRLMQRDHPNAGCNRDTETYVADIAEVARGLYGHSGRARIEARLLAALLPGSRTHIRRVLREVSNRNEILLDRLTEPLTDV